MNEIFNKLKPHRKYHRKPICENLGGICTFERCRCFYPLMEPETKRQIDENLHHRERVIKRRREIELNKLDEENCEDYGLRTDWSSYPIKGEYFKEKQAKKKYRNMSWLAIFIIPMLVVVYLLVIVVIDLFY